MIKKVVVCLLSGGVDSTVAAVMKASEPDTFVILLSIYYGQGAEQAEIQQSVAVADWFENKFDNIIEHFTMRISGESRWRKKGRQRTGGFVGWRSPEGGYSQAGYPSTRDETFALIAAAGAEAYLSDFDRIPEAEVVLATTGEDLENFEDIDRSTYETQLNDVLARKMLPRAGKPIRIVLPLIDMTKAVVIQRGLDIGAPLHLTWSCYFGTPGNPCGTCDQCRWRRTAFGVAGVSDPAA